MAVKPKKKKRSVGKAVNDFAMEDAEAARHTACRLKGRRERAGI